MTASEYRHTYQLASQVGTLNSRRWSFDFIVTASLIFLLLVPFTMAYYLADVTVRSRWIAHVIIVVILTVWIFVTFVYGCVYLANRNQTDASNYDNPYNDEKWCLVYAGLSGAPCYISAPTGVFALSVSTPAMLQFVFQLVVFIMLIVDLFIVLVGIRGAADRDAVRVPEEDPLTSIKSQYSSGSSKRSKKMKK